MPLLFSPVCSPTQLLQLQSFILFRICVCSVPPPLSCGACHTLATIGRLPLSKHTGGGGTTPAFSGWHVYLQFTWGVPLPPSPVKFSSHSHFYKLSSSKVAGRVPPLLPSLAGLFIYSSMRDCPSPLQCSGHPTLFATCLLLLLLLFIVQFFFFSFFPGQSVQGAMLILPRVVCGSTVCCLAHLVVCVSLAIRSWRLVAQDPSWFLHLMWSVDAMYGLGVWRSRRSRSFASSQWFFL
jgi:hypothetical protein